MEAKPPIFQSIFGAQWEKLPSVFRQHYANRPFCSDEVTVNGLMGIELSLFAKLLAPFMRITGILSPFEGKDVPVTVHFASEQNSNAVCFKRIFHYPDRKPYHFSSRVVPVVDQEVIEWMASGIGWHACYEFNGHKVIIKHRGYKIRLFGKVYALPLELLLGRGYAEEEVVDENCFRMHMKIKHKLFGTFYAYSGEFKISKVQMHE